MTVERRGLSLSPSPCLLSFGEGGSLGKGRVSEEIRLLLN